MTNIAIDPYILAYPNNNISSEFEDYIDKILELDSLKDKIGLNFIISSNTSTLLIEEKNFPYWDDLNDTLSKCGLNTFIQPKDIISTLERILKYSFIEDFLEIEDILYKDVKISPDEIENGRSGSYLEELNRLLMYICISHELNHIDVLATTELVKDVVSIEGELIELDSKKIEINDLPQFYNNDIKTFNTTEKLLSLIDPIKIWKLASNDLEYDNAVSIYISQRIGKQFEDKNWHFGKRFFVNMKAHGFLHQESKINSLLKSLADTILGENLGATHALRSGNGGNNPQVTRNRDKAWRRDIDYEYHLHYWELENGFEFASLVVHNDMSIQA